MYHTSSSIIEVSSHLPGPGAAEVWKPDSGFFTSTPLPYRDCSVSASRVGPLIQDHSIRWNVPLHWQSLARFQLELEVTNRDVSEMTRHGHSNVYARHWHCLEHSPLVTLRLQYAVLTSGR